MNKIIITNAHAHGFAFACDTETQGQVFIPVHIADGFDLAPGDEINAVLVPNYQDKSDKGTPWQAVKLQRPVEVVQVTSKEHLVKHFENASNRAEYVSNQDEYLSRLDDKGLEEVVLSFLNSRGYHTTSEISDYFALDVKTIFDCCVRLFKSNKIVRADVTHNVEKVTLTLWAIDDNCFIEVN